MYPFVPARNFTPGGNLPPKRIIIHRAECPNVPKAAENVAHYFKATTTPASAHFCVDADSVVQCVQDGDRAWHAPPNAGTLGIEHAGYSADNDWSTPASQAMLELSARLCAELCAKYGIPVVWLTVDDLQHDRMGITDHATVSLAFRKSSHTDPGPHFPREWYIARVAALKTLLEVPNE